LGDFQRNAKLRHGGRASGAALENKEHRELETHSSRGRAFLGGFSSLRRAVNLQVRNFGTAGNFACGGEVMWPFSQNKNEESEVLPRGASRLTMEAQPKRGFQVGDRVVVVRFPDDDEDDLADFENVYGRIGEIAAVCERGVSCYHYTVKFAGWDGGWKDDFCDEGPHWGVYHRNLRRVVSKSDQQRS
jgi:hypothetical protein